MSKLEEQLAKVVEKAISIAEETGQFVIEQASDLIKEFYRWEILGNLFWVLLPLLLFYITRRIILSFPKNKEYEDVRWDEIVYKGRVYDRFTLIFPQVLIGVICAIVSVIYLYNLMFVLVAPKIYLIKYFLN